MKKAIVFPYNGMISGIFYNQFFPEFQITSYATYPCLVHDNIEPSIHQITYDCKAAVEQTDIIIWAEYFSCVEGTESSVQKCKEDIFEIINFAIERKKTVYCCELLSEYEKRIFESKAKIFKATFVYCSNKLDSNYEIKLKKQNAKNISIPTVFVEGATNDCCKFQLQLLLRKALLNNGVRFSQIGSKHYSELFGFHSFPDFMYQSDVGEIVKISMFNAFVNNIVAAEKPNVLVIGIPHGFFNESKTDNYGALHYMVSCAVGCSVAFVSLPFFDCNNTFFDELEKLLNYRYCQHVGAFFVSNIMRDMLEDGKNISASNCILPSELVYNQVALLGRENLYTYSSFNDEMIINIIKQVSDYGNF